MEPWKVENLAEHWAMQMAEQKATQRDKGLVVQRGLMLAALKAEQMVERMVERKDLMLVEHLVEQKAEQ
jgi:hypothetical protein